MKQLRLSSILLAGLLLCNAAQAKVRVVAVGVKNPTSCPALKPLVSDLKGMTLPDSWTIYLTCTTVAWDAVQMHFDNTATRVAFTSRAENFSVINGDMYKTGFIWGETWPRIPREVLKHELGHILCKCADEDGANKAGDVQ